MASIPAQGKGVGSTHGTMEKTARVTVSVFSSARNGPGFKRIVNGGPQSSMRANVATVDKSSIKGPDKGEG